MSGEYVDAALVLVGHGTALNAESAAPVYQHAAALRERRCFGKVREAFWKQPPQLLEVLASVTLPRVFIVPFFISEGYFSEVVIPRALGFALQGKGEFERILRRESQTLFYCRPVGTHRKMTEVLLSRARQVVAGSSAAFPPAEKETTLFIAGHGTGRNENSRQAVELQAGRIRSLGIYGAVEAVFLEEEPAIKGCVERAATRNVVVVPFFISDGLHAREDIPVLLGEAEPVVRARLANNQPVWNNPAEIAGRKVWYAPAVGMDPLMADLIQERVQEWEV